MSVPFKSLYIINPTNIIICTFIPCNPLPYRVIIILLPVGCIDVLKIVYLSDRLSYFLQCLTTIYSPETFIKLIYALERLLMLPGNSKHENR